MPTQAYEGPPPRKQAGHVLCVANEREMDDIASLVVWKAYFLSLGLFSTKLDTAMLHFSVPSLH